MAESHFSAGFIFKKFADAWYALTVRDMRFQDLKAAGGMWVEGEAPLTTLIRELRQELGVEVVNTELIYEDSTGNHSKHFYLVTEVSDLPALDEKRLLKEFRAGKQGDVLEMSWTKLNDFGERIYSGQMVAFSKALALAAKNQEFFKDNQKLVLDRFPVSE